MMMKKKEQDIYLYSSICIVSIFIHPVTYTVHKHSSIKCTALLLISYEFFLALLQLLQRTLAKYRNF